MPNSLLIIGLALGTLILVMIVASVQLRRHRNSQIKRGEAPGGLAGPEKKDLH